MLAREAEIESAENATRECVTEDWIDHTAIQQTKLTLIDWCACHRSKTQTLIAVACYT